MNRIAFIGLGWMGESFAEVCYEKGFKILGSTTQVEKLQRFNQKGYEVCIYDLNKENKFEGFKDPINLLVYSIPPSVSENYVEKTLTLLNQMQKANSKLKIVYISSTSVYGSESRIVSEASTIKPETANANKMVEIEKFVLEKNGVVFRCGGLVGKKRHPVKHLSGRKNVAKPKAPVNLVHLNDVVGFFE